MALGDERGNSNKLYENTYYSRVKFKDYDNKLALGFQFKSGMLVVDISKEKEGFQYDSVASIFITPTKAKILLEQIAKLKKDIEDGVAIRSVGYGINAGMGEIVTVLVLHADNDGKVTITIGKVDGSGTYTSKTNFTFAKQFHYGLKWNDVEKMDVEKQYLDTVEFDQFCETIQQFAIASNGATAYTVADLARYDTRSILNKMNPIYDKLGIERNTGNGRKTYSGNNFFNNGNNSGATSNHKSYDEAIDDLPFEED